MTALEELRWHWGDAYQITVDAAGKWVALPRDGREVVLAARSQRELRIKIRADYRPTAVSPSR